MDACNALASDSPVYCESKQRQMDASMKRNIIYVGPDVDGTRCKARITAINRGSTDLRHAEIQLRYTGSQAISQRHLFGDITQRNDVMPR